MTRVIVLLSALAALTLGGCASVPKSVVLDKVVEHPDGTRQVVAYQEIVDARCEVRVGSKLYQDRLVNDATGEIRYVTTKYDLRRPVCPMYGQPPAGVVPVQGTTYQPAASVYVPAPVQYDVAQPVYAPSPSPRAAMPSVQCIRQGIGCPGSN